MYRATLLYTLLLVHLFLTPSVIMAFADPPAMAQVHVDQALEEIHTRFTRSSNRGSGRESTLKTVAKGAAVGAATSLAVAGAAKLYDKYKHRHDHRQSAGNGHSGHGHHNHQH